MSDTEFDISDEEILTKAEKKVEKKNPIRRSQQFKEAVKEEAKKMIKRNKIQTDSDDEDWTPCTSKEAKRRQAKRKPKKKVEETDEEETTIREVASGTRGKKKASKRNHESDEEDEEEDKPKSKKGKIWASKKQQEIENGCKEKLNLKKHKLKSTIHCKYCSYSFGKHIYYEHHMASKHMCKFCRFMGSKTNLTHHIKQCYKKQIGSGVNPKRITQVTPFVLSKPLRGYLMTFKHHVNQPVLVYEKYMLSMWDNIKRALEYSLEGLDSIKFQLGVWCTFKREIGIDMYEITPSRPVYSYQLILYNKSQIEVRLQECYEKIKNSIEIFEAYGSGWVFDTAMGLSIHVGKFRPILGGCKIEMPLSLLNKKCIVNVKSDDNMCFKWAVLSILNPIKKNSNRVSKYQEVENACDFSCVNFPTTPSDFPKFEHVNNIALNVFSYCDEKGILPFYISKWNYTTTHKEVNLLLLDGVQDHGHFVGIRSVSKLLGKRNFHARFLCYYCMNRFRYASRKHFIDEHVSDCKNFNFQKLKVPKVVDGEAPILKFKNFRNQLKVGYVVYADFESILKKKNKSRNLRLRIKSKHVPCGFSYGVINYDGKIIRKSVYRGKDCVDLFLKEMYRISDIVMAKYSMVKELVMSTEEENLFRKQKSCFICKTEFTKDDIRVRDHDHLTGKFRAAAHQHCNLNFKQKLTLPVVLHNFRGYDSHLIMHGFRNCGNEFRVVPTNSEKYGSIKVDNITFLDSLQFLPHSLESLVESLKSDISDNFKILNQCFNKDECELLKRKGVYPYSYIDSFKKFKETELPAKKCFYVLTKGEHISDEDYEHAKDVFSGFKLKNMGEYHDLYLLSDSLLLACVFENFRRLCLKYYELDPLYYISAPGIAWDSALKMTGVELEQLTDINMYIFMEKGIRGGISCITKRKASANNVYMNSYNENKPSKYIMYFDMNNLYGIALKQFLPVGGFKWLKKSEVNSFDVMGVGDADEHGYVLECTLSYPKELHDDHNDYCLAVEKTNIPRQKLSPFQKKLLRNSQIKYNENTVKLIPHLGVHKKYIVHYRNLKYYLEKGLKLEKIHRVIKFRQADWLRGFIDFNTQKRMECKSKVEKDLFKLFNNSVFGKTMQNNRKHMTVKIVNVPSEAEKLIRSPQFNGFKVVTDNLCTFVMQKRSVYLDRPIYCGFSCLDLSKLFMYKFHYEKMKKWYPGNNLQLLMSDTDSLCYQIKTDDVYKDLMNHRKYFDFSEYDSSHLLYSCDNKMVLGKMKDEAHGKIIEKFVGLGAKTYSMMGETVTKKSAKGVPKSVKEKLLKHELYERVIDYQSQYYCTSAIIRSHNHKIRTRIQSKKAIHSFDSKRFLRECGVKTYAYGHYKIVEN